MNVLCFHFNERLKEDGLFTGLVFRKKCLENGVCLPTRSRLPSLPPSVTMAMPYLRDAHTVHEHDDDNISYEDSEEFPYMYVESDEEDVYIYSDDDSILSDASTS